jgi:hypothetical protein
MDVSAGENLTIDAKHPEAVIAAVAPPFAIGTSCFGSHGVGLQFL